MSAWRLLARWNFRMLRTERRQQVMLLALSATAVALSVGAVVAAFNLAAPPTRTYGLGQVRASIVGDPAPVRAALEDQAHRFGIVRTTTVALPGSTRRLEVRVQDPDDAVARPLLDLVDGRWPVAPTEVAVTDDLAALLPDGRADLGAASVTVVGVVENPTDLGDDFVLASGFDPFGVDDQRISTLFLVDAEPADVTFPGGVGSIGVESGGTGTPVDMRTLIAILVNVVTAVATLEVALLIGAGFAVLAARRSRHYGLLAAVGATPRQLRLAAGLNGVAIGVLGALIGAAVGVATAAAVVPTMEVAVGHRIDFAVPWWTIGPSSLLAVAAAGAAAWWPARTLSTQSIVMTLAALRPRPRPVRRATAVGAVATAVGLSAMVYGVAELAALPAVAGIVLAVVGLLLLTPGAVTIIGRVGAGLPLAGRLAARAVARQQGRSAAVIAALTIAFGIPIGLAVATTAIEDRDRRTERNLPDTMAIVWLPGAEEPAPDLPADLDPAAARATLAAISVAHPGMVIAPIEVALEPDSERFQHTFDRLGSAQAVLPAFAVRPTTEDCTCDVYAFGDRDEAGAELVFSGHDAWLASPELLAALGLELAPAPADRSGPGVSRWADARLNRNRDSSDPSGALALESGLPPYRSIAPVLIRPTAMADYGWEAVTVGWLVVSDEPLPPTFVEDASAAARSTGGGEGETSALTGGEPLVEVRTEPPARSGVRTLGVVVGAIVGLGILVSAVGLATAESSADRRILEAIGASAATGRRISAATAAIMALAGALVAVPVGYLALVAMVANSQFDYRFVVPVSSLVVVLVLVPVLAAAVGWLAGRDRRTGRVHHRGLAAAALATILVTSACGPGEETQRTGEAPVELGAGDVGCDPGIDRALRSWAGAGFAGSVAWLGGERQCVAAYGRADQATERVNTPDTVFSIGSVTKAVTAAAVLGLVDDGVLALDDPAGRHVAGLTGEAAELTVRDLLLHTSGLTGEHGADHAPLSRDAAVASIDGLDLSFEPGRRYLYSNAGYTLLALIVDAVSDGYRHHVRTSILRAGDGTPIGGFWDGEPAPAGPRAVGYLAGGEPGELGDFDGPHWGLDGNGGVAMTALEMASWARDLFGGRILSPAATELLTTTSTHLGPDGIELPGWVEIDERVLGEPIIAASGGGGSIGQSMDVAWFPRSGRVLVIAQNASDRAADTLLGDIAPALVAGTGIPGPRPIPEADPAVVAAISGRYVLGPGDTITVTPDEQGLEVTAQGPGAIELLFPTPDSAAAEVARHEESALAFVNGETAEGRAVRETTEAEHGPVTGVQVLATFEDGELVTLLGIDFEDSSVMLGIALNEYGGSEAYGFGRWPSGWFVWSGSFGGGGSEAGAGFVAHNPNEDQPRVMLRPSDDGLTIDGPTGARIVPRAEG